MFRSQSTAGHSVASLPPLVEEQITQGRGSTSGADVGVSSEFDFGHRSPSIESRSSGDESDLSDETDASSGSGHHRYPPITDDQLVEIRAAQRTFEGAYIRTALGQFGFALVVLRIFTAEFYSIGALFAAYGAGILVIALYRRHQGNSQFFIEEIWQTTPPQTPGPLPEGTPGIEDVEVFSKFRTSGNVVCVMTALSLLAYCSLLVLIFRLRE